MAIVSRISTLRFDGAAGAFRQWQATATVQDTAEGGSVVVTIVQTSGGVAPAEADTLTLNFYDGAAGLILAATLTPSSGSQTVTYHFTNTGNSGGSNRHGTVLIDIRATKTTGGPTATYDYETDGSPSTPPSLFTATADRGYIRGTTTATLAVSNISAGGGQNLPASFPDSLFVRATLGSASYINRAQTLILSEGATPKRTGTSAAGTGTTWDVTFSGTSTTTGRVNDGLTASSHTLTSSITLPNDATTGIAYTSLTSTTAGTITTDPRRRRQPLFQLDDNTFGTPPISKHVATQRRTTTQQGFLASRTINARGEGQSGLTHNVTLTPRRPGTALSQTGIVTTTQGGEAGWSTSLMAWSSSLPGGIWDKAYTYTAPSDATNAAHTSQVAGTSTEYTLIAKNPDYEVRVTISHATGQEGRHFIAGQKITMVASLIDFSTNKRVDPSLITSVTFSLVRATPSDANGLSNSFQFFNGTTWVDWTAGTAKTSFTAAVSPVDAQTYEYPLADTSNYGLRDFRANALMTSEGVVYSGTSAVINVDTLNPHDTASAASGGGGSGAGVYIDPGFYRNERKRRKRNYEDSAEIEADLKSAFALFEARPNEQADAIIQPFRVEKEVPSAELFGNDWIDTRTMLASIDKIEALLKLYDDVLEDDEEAAAFMQVILSH